MHVRLAMVILLLTAPLVQGSAQAAFRHMGRVNETTWLSHLDNGVVVIARHVPGAPAASVRAFVRSGSAHEGEYAGSGISYVLERVILGGTTEHRTATESRAVLNRIAAKTGSYTTKHTTVFHLQVPPEHLDQAFSVLSDWLFHSSIRPDEVDAAKEAISRQLAAIAGDQDAQAQDLFYKTLFQTHPVRYPVMGYAVPMANLEAISLINHYHRHYVPGRVVVVVAGDFSGGIASVYRGARNTFGAVNPRPVPQTIPPSEPRQASPRQLEVLGDGKDTRVFLGWQTTGSGQEEKDYYALEVLAALLTEGPDSLFPAVGAPGNPLHRLNTYHLVPENGVSAFMLSAEIEGDGGDAFLADLYRVLRTVQKGKVDVNRMEAVKRQLVAQVALAQLDVASITERMGTDFLATGDPNYQEVYTRELGRVTAEGLQRVADLYLQARRHTLVTLRPSTAAAAITAREAPKLTAHTLDNGLQVLVRPSLDTKAVTLQLFARGGLLFENEKNQGIFRLLSRTLPGGTASRSAKDIEAALDKMGADLITTSGHTSLGLTLTVLRQDLPKALELLVDLTTRPTLPQEAIDQAKAAIGRERADLANNWRYTAYARLQGALWKNHPLRLDVNGTGESLAAITRQDLTALRASHLVAKNMVLAVFGDVDPSDLTAVLQRTVGTMPPGTVPALSTQPETRTAAEDISLPGPAGHLVYGLGYLSPGLTHPDLAAVSVMAGLLSGVNDTGGLLQDNLYSGSKPLADYVDMQLQPGVDQGALLMVFHGKPDQKDALAAAVNTQLNALAQTPVPQDRLDFIKQMLVTIRRQGEVSLEDQARSKTLDVLFGLGTDYDETMVAKLQAITPADVQRVTAQYLQHPVRLWIAP